MSVYELSSTSDFEPSISFMSLSSIPPELFPLIASCVPLRSARQTLFSLLQVDHYFYSIFRRLLYARLVLGTEDSAITVIQKILDEPQLGMTVTELYIMADLSFETRQGMKPFDVVEGLQMLLKGKLLPHLTALGVYLMNYWEFDEEWNIVRSHGELDLDLWRTLRAECPRLQSLSLRDLGNQRDESFRMVQNSLIDEISKMKGLSTLRFEWSFQGDYEVFSEAISKGLPQLASSLHTLSLAIDISFDSILHLNFPHLKSLRLQDVEPASDPSKFVAFCRRHRQLESLSLINRGSRWFFDNAEEDFLPNLKHLKADFGDIRHLVPVLPQLISLSFTQSFRCQIPYLLRAVLEGGLPGLKSLEINFSVGNSDDSNVEGMLWCETVDGEFCGEIAARERDTSSFMEDYMLSIVRGAPNLEELGLHGVFLESDSLALLGPSLSQFRDLKRFYYRGFSTHPDDGDVPPKETHQELLANFLTSTEALARICQRLERVTSISARYLPYISCVVLRDFAGVVRVRRVDGIGMEIPADEDDPFPANNLA